MVARLGRTPASRLKSLLRSLRQSLPQPLRQPRRPSGQCRLGETAVVRLSEAVGKHAGSPQRLVGVQAWVAVGVGTMRPPSLADRAAAANAFRHVLPGQLDMDAAG